MLPATAVHLVLDDANLNPGIGHLGSGESHADEGDAAGEDSHTISHHLAGGALGCLSRVLLIIFLKNSVALVSAPALKVVKIERHGGILFPRL